MSIEANTFEVLTIRNENEKTRGIAQYFGEYLMSTWGIIKLVMHVDGKEYRTEEDSLDDSSEIYELCEHLEDYKSVVVSLRSQNAGGFAWRSETDFFKLLTDDEEVKSCVTYKSYDYYDTDNGIDLYSYGRNGVEKPEFDKTPDKVSDIMEWFCYTYDIHFENEDDFDVGTHDIIMDNLVKVATSCNLEEDSVEDDGCEIFVEGSLSFKTSSISEMADLLQKAVDAIKDVSGATCEIEINAVPDGAGDYDFASVRFVLRDGKVCVEYCRF